MNQTKFTRIRVYVPMLLLLAFASGCGKESPAPVETNSSPSVKTTIVLPAGDPSLKMPVGQLSSDGAITTTGKEGALVAGPSINLEAGRYVARWYGNWGQKKSGDRVVFDVYWDGTGPWPSTNPLPGQMRSAEDGILAEVPFEISSSASNLQTRVWVAASSDLLIKRIEVRSRLQ